MQTNDKGPNRRDMMKMTAAAAAAIPLTGLRASANTGGPTDLSAVDLSNAIHARSISCVEVMNAYLDQIERINPQVNAIVSLLPREDLVAQAQAADDDLAAGKDRGWLHGMPQAIKDLDTTVGIRTTYGSPIMKDYMPKSDTIMVERIRASGAILIGKTNTPEFGLGSHTYNEVFGTTLNAYDQKLSAGGSSGGAAVALATHMLPVADGSDMMGSLRNPAGWNNVFGFRPSAGRVPYGPTGELFYQQLGYGGPMGRSVADMAMLLSIQAGYDPRTPLSLDGDAALFTQSLDHDFKGARIGWLGDLDGYLTMQAGVMDVCQKALANFETLGCTVEPAKIDFDMAKLWETWLTLRGFLVSGLVAPLAANPETKPLLKPEAVWENELGLKQTSTGIYQASVARSDFYREMLRLYDSYDYLVLPTAQVWPFDATQHWPAEIEGKQMDTYHRWMEIVIPGTLSGVPVIAVPAGFSDSGLPMGLQIMARPRADLAALQIGHAWQNATDYLTRKSPLL
ncbi:amidase [Paracoccus sp. (in: a-proteobacteria)]|uniref:amidase n=1 Tax=Paracoccus sp. TaxID=267 RepID=UPI003A8774DC